MRRQRGPISAGTGEFWRVLWGLGECGRSEMTRTLDWGESWVEPDKDTRWSVRQSGEKVRNPECSCCLVEDSSAWRRGRELLHGGDRWGRVLDILVCWSWPTPERPRKGHAGLGKALNCLNSSNAKWLAGNARVPMFSRVDTLHVWFTHESRTYCY